MLPGWEVTRLIPVETLVGLISGQYKLYGGVIRHAAGTPQAGQIVKHLIPTALSPFGTISEINFIPGIVANVQLQEIKNKDNSFGLNKNTGIGLEKEKKLVTPAIRKLVARSSVFQGYTAQYELLQAQQIKPSDFEQKLSNLSESSVEGYLILEPATEELIEATA